MVRLAWATKAVEDIFQIQQYFSSVSEKYAHAFVDQLFKKVEILKTYPNLGRVVPELNQRDIRELLFRQYRIVYRIVSADRIDVLSIHPGAKPLSKDSIFL